jgi:signal transduction histidine kinase
VSRLLASLRVRLAVLGVVAIYAPVLVLLAVAATTDTETVTTADGLRTQVVSGGTSPWVWATAALLAPAACVLAWTWAGRAVRPLAEAAEQQRRLIEETSHALRTPLAVLATTIDVALADPAPTLPGYRDGLQGARDAAGRVRGVVDGLLADARGRARTLERRAADLDAVVADAVTRALPLADARGVRLEHAATGRLTARIDVDAVTRAVTNLLDNAIRHAPAGSAVAIAARATATSVAVTVTDHGPGIPAAQQAQVFGRFWRADGGGAAGLGLPIARQVAEAHGGALTLHSPGPDGDGCAFTLTLRR